MPKTSAYHHLYLNHQTWMFRFRWPKDVIKGVDGQKEFHKSLKTSVLQEALSERDVLLAHCKKMVRRVREGNEQELEDEKERFKRLWLTPDEDISENADDVDVYRDQLQQEVLETAVEQSIKRGWRTYRLCGGREVR